MGGGGGGGEGRMSRIMRERGIDKDVRSGCAGQGTAFMLTRHTRHAYAQNGVLAAKGKGTPVIQCGRARMQQ